MEDKQKQIEEMTNMVIDIFDKQYERQMAADVLLHRIHNAMSYLDWHGRMGVTVVMSRDVRRVIQAGAGVIAENRDQKCIMKIFGCDVKIVEGKGILFVGYDALGGGFDA
jgi:hypothetical protein